MSLKKSRYIYRIEKIIQHFYKKKCASIVSRRSIPFIQSQTGSFSNIINSQAKKLTLYHYMLSQDYTKDEYIAKYLRCPTYNFYNSANKDRTIYYSERQEVMIGVVNWDLKNIFVINTDGQSIWVILYRRFTPQSTISHRMFIRQVFGDKLGCVHSGETNCLNFQY